MLKIQYIFINTIIFDGNEVSIKIFTSYLDLHLTFIMY